MMTLTGYHKVLDKQLRKYCGNMPMTKEIEAFIMAVNNSYIEADKDRILMERAMNISSEELAEANRKVKEEYEQKLNAQRLASEKELIFNTINENIIEAIYRRSPTQGMIFANKAFVQLFGYDSEEEVLKTKCYDFYTNPDTFFEINQQLEKENMIKGMEILYRRKDGSTFWGMLSIISLKDDEGNIYIDGAIVDITQQKNNENALLRSNEELSKINEELDSFVYSIGHDLRAPIASTLGLIQLCKTEENLAILNKYHQLQEKSLLKLDSFIQDVLGYARNARLNLEITPINIQRSLDSIIEVYYSSIGKKDLKVEVEIEQDSPFYSDQYRFELIFNNLISNAFRYYNPAQIHPYLHISAKVSQKETRIIFSDNGLGIEEKHLNKIFDMFYRANTSGIGSGLGLYIVKEAVAKLSGSINVESKIGIGTTFELILPNLDAKYHY